MAASRFPTTQYTSDVVVESAGAILIELMSRRICLLHDLSTGEWLLAKGRRNVGESRAAAAVRELGEETGYQCRLLPLTMTTRAPPADETGSCLDEARVHHSACEPFMVTCRHLDGERHVKIIWWYIAAIDEAVDRTDGETQCNAELMSFDQAENRLTYQLDRDIVRNAISIVEYNLNAGQLHQVSTNAELG